MFQCQSFWLLVKFNKLNGSLSFLIKNSVKKKQAFHADDGST